MAIRGVGVRAFLKRLWERRKKVPPVTPGSGARKPQEGKPLVRDEEGQGEQPAGGQPVKKKLRTPVHPDSGKHLDVDG